MRSPSKGNQPDIPHRGASVYVFFHLRQGTGSPLHNQGGSGGCQRVPASFRNAVNNRSPLSIPVPARPNSNSESFSPGVFLFCTGSNHPQNRCFPFLVLRSRHHTVHTVTSSRQPETVTSGSQTGGGSAFLISLLVSKSRWNICANALLGGAGIFFAYF